jgi:hypothetical protein
MHRVHVANDHVTLRGDNGNGPGAPDASGDQEVAILGPQRACGDIPNHHRLALADCETTRADIWTDDASIDRLTEGGRHVRSRSQPQVLPVRVKDPQTHRDIRPDQLLQNYQQAVERCSKTVPADEPCKRLPSLPRAADARHGMSQRHLPCTVLS